MAIRVITGTLESASPYEIGKDGVNKWQWWRIVDTDGRDHVIKDVRAREYMTSHASTDLEGTFVFTVASTPIFIGLKYDGKVVDEHEVWRQRIEGWPTILLVFTAIVLGLGGLLFSNLVTGVVGRGLIALCLMVSPIFFLIFILATVNAAFERFPKKHELAAALERAP